MSELATTPPTRYGWARWGDINAFFGLMLDNLAVMVMLVALLTSATPGFTPQFVLTHMIPGTALGVLLGDLVYTWMAFRLARRTGRTDVTAMPLGLDTPSTFGVAILVLVPTLEQYLKDMKSSLAQGEGLSAAQHHDAMLFAWHVGLVVLVLVGIFKVALAPLGNAVRRWVPRAGLLGSLAAIALVLIAFVPLLLDIATVPLVGLLSLTVILVALVAHRALPGNFPGALAAVVVGIAAYMIFEQLGKSLGWPLVPPRERQEATFWQLPQLLPFVTKGLGDWSWWGQVLATALERMPVVLPFALATIVGGIDCTESAAAAGDEYDTRTVLLTEGVASLAAGLLGGVLQTTPYIGQPAYKAMGGRAAYTLAAALFIGAVGLFGWFGWLHALLPKAAMFPILVFVGLEITAQSFRATPTRHYPALALAVLPALAYLAHFLIAEALGPNKPATPDASAKVLTLRCLANGFIVTSLLWAAALAALLDGRLKLSAVYLLVAGVFALFGIIHSPLPDAPIALPWEVWGQLQNIPGNPLYQSPYHWAAAYGSAALLLLGLACFPTKPAH